jgi:DNA-directed RNA polymerase specialized sigma24 family protein
MSPGDPSPLDTLDGAFRLLASDPSPLTIDGRRIGLGLPARPIPLLELRSMLLHPSTGFAARDAALTILVDRAQHDGGAWLVGLAGVLLPGLRRTAGRLARDFPGDTSDLDCEVLAGFVEAVDGFDASRGRVAARLLWAAYRRGYRLRRRELTELSRRCGGARSTPPPVPWGHPDLVLARAVAARVLTEQEAELISATRIGDTTLPDLAAATGVAADTLRHRRRRAEWRLAAWLDHQ